MRTRPTSLLATWLVLVSTLCFATGCDPHAQDRADIRKVTDDLARAYRDGDGDAAVKLVTQESLDHYGKLVKLALDGKPDEVKKLPPNDKFEVLNLRARCTRKQLQGMGGAAYQKFVTKEGWWSSPDIESWTQNMIGLRIASDGLSATTPLFIDKRHRTDHTLRWQKVSGLWRFDELATRPFVDELVTDEAEFLGMSVDQLIISAIEEDIGKSVGDGIWNPMPKR